MALSSNSDFPVINFNGTFLPAGQAIVKGENRGFRYGDGLFETMLVRPDGVRLWKYHFERMIAGIQLLRFKTPSSFSFEGLERQILDLCAINAGHSGFKPAHSRWTGMETPGEPEDQFIIDAAGAWVFRARLTVFRPDGGLLDPADTLPNYIIQSYPFTPKWNEGGLAIDIFPDVRKSCDAISGLKSNSYLLYTLAGIYARDGGLDDCLVLNSHDRLADSTIANLFYVKGGEFFTPPLSEGCVAGVMRRHLLAALPEAGYVVHQRPVHPDDLLGADEVFLTNAIRGVQWVRVFKGVSYGCRLAGAAYREIVERL